MDRAHTKGPWRVDPVYLSEVQTAADRTIASCWHEHAAGRTITINGVIECSLEESAANARLIAAAPDMFDAIKLALDSAVLFARAGDEAVSKEAMSALRAAIAKAEGLGQRADATPSSPSMEGR